MCLEDISFSYGTTPVISEATAGFLHGTTTALVGPSGSGKSTLAHLLCRLWDVDEGRIELGGADVRHTSLQTLNRHIATVFQDVTLFNETVHNNLCLARPDATRAHVVNAAKAARAHEFIQELPNGYDTVLANNGADLSGGQRQRLSIARALLKDAPILVLDEATASVDVDAEAQIQAALSTLSAGRTTIVIAHRLWTIQHVDQILVLDHGRIVQRGSHNDLMQSGGLYKDLWDAQQQSLSWTVKRRF